MNIYDIPNSLLPHYMSIYGTDAVIEHTRDMYNVDLGKNERITSNLPVRGIIASYKDSDIDNVTTFVSDIQFITQESYNIGSKLIIKNRSCIIKDREIITVNGVDIACVHKLRYE